MSKWRFLAQPQLMLAYSDTGRQAPSDPWFQTQIDEVQSRRGDKASTPKPLSEKSNKATVQEQNPMGPRTTTAVISKHRHKAGHASQGRNRSLPW